MSVDMWAVASCVTMLGWLILTEWVPLAPLNDLGASTQGERGRAAVLNYAALLVIATGVLTGTTVGAIVAQVLVVAWLVGHLLSWWLPYFGLSSERQRGRTDGRTPRTLKVLPAEGHDVVVDVQHMVVGLLTLPMVVFVSVHSLEVLS